MKKMNHFSSINTKLILEAKEKFGTPLYLYEENLIIEKCRSVLAMSNAYGLTVRYAMKANSNRTLLQIIDEQGLLIDASSLNEVRRAKMAGISYEKIILTTQEVPENEDLAELEQMLIKGLTYNVCSLRQLRLIGDFAKAHKPGLSIRIHPGVGSGESASRNTGDNYSCFGVHLSDIETALEYADKKDIKFTQVHVHIGSGADPEKWKQNIDLELAIIEKYFPDAKTVSFGGGLKEARMPEENSADIKALGDYAKMRIEEFYQKTGRKLKMEIEPGTFIVANSGYIITKIIDKKSTGKEGLNFLITNGGMEVNVRPLMYGAQHPLYLISKTGELLSSEFASESPTDSSYQAVIVGRCCESGDSQCLDDQGRNSPRKMAEPEIGDLVVIGGAGAYCSSMAPFNYNSYTQSAEVLLLQSGQLKLIRKKQTLAQVIENEI